MSSWPTDEYLVRGSISASASPPITHAAPDRGRAGPLGVPATGVRRLFLRCTVALVPVSRRHEFEGINRQRGSWI